MRVTVFNVARLLSVGHQAFILPPWTRRRDSIAGGRLGRHVVLILQIADGEVSVNADWAVIATASLHVCLAVRRNKP